MLAIAKASSATCVFDGDDEDSDAERMPFPWDNPKNPEDKKQKLKKW